MGYVNMDKYEFIEDVIGTLGRILEEEDLDDTAFDDLQRLYLDAVDEYYVMMRVDYNGA